MHLVDEDPRLDARVAVHELARLVEVGVEDPDAADLALVGDRADDRQQPVRPQREVPPPVLPDDPLGGVRPVVGPDLEDHQAVRPGLGEHLPHEFVGDLGHAIPPFQRCWWTQLHIPTKLAAWARVNGVHPQTAYRWFRQGTMPVPARRLPSGTILVEVPGGGVPDPRAVVYARVCAHDQRADLDRQVARLSAWAAGQGLGVVEVVTEVGSAMNGRRPRLRRLLADPTVTMIVVEHRDRLARFGVEYLEAALGAQGRRLVVVDAGEATDDLVRDMIDVLTSFCARLYGRRGARNRALRAVTCAKRSPGHADPTETEGEQR